MKKFSEFTYTRPDISLLAKQFGELTGHFREAASAGEQQRLMSDINQLRKLFYSLSAIVYIRHTINTEDEFYDQEKEFFDENLPLFEGWNSDFYSALVSSPFRTELEQACGRQLFRLAEMWLKTFKQEIIEDLQVENKLSSEYVKLKAGARIMFDGEEYNLSQMVPFIESRERDIRRRASQAVSAFYAGHAGEFDRIYDELVKVRHTIALKLGFDSFVPLAYARLGRSDYDASAVAGYRDQVHRHIVPLARQLRRRQAARLGLDNLRFYDESLNFLTGNATPKGDSRWILDHGRRMYEEVSAETAEFFNYMAERELLDLETRKGKAGGGYCHFIPDELAPFIFANFNGTSADVDVLTHEAGHAFQCYRSRHTTIPEYYSPTYEACEIHSMSMEFFTWPWMKNFFQDDVEKFKFAHLSGSLLFIPYGVSVDEFQHWVYENPSATPAERRARWRQIEKKYLPHRDYDGDDFLEGGGFWFRQAHIFARPFYYIDYTLAQVCAFEFWGRAMEDRQSAWQDYLKLCDLGGSLPFTGLVREAGLNNPFDEGTIEKIIKPVSEWLVAVDDSAL